MTFIQIPKGAIATLADGAPAYMRGGFVSQKMIDTYGSYAAARKAVADRRKNSG